MIKWNQLKSRVRMLLHASQEDREMDEELRFHLDQEMEHGRHRGLTPAEARRRALLAFGGVDRVSEETRDARGTAHIENAVRDLRFAIRALRRDPRFTVVAVLTLAIGIGATTAVFSLANSFLLRPIPGVQSADELIVLELADASGMRSGLSHANIADLLASSPAITALAGHAPLTMQTRTRQAGAVEVEATIVDGDYFGVLGVRPLRGRWFTEHELAPDVPGSVVVISDRFRASYFGDAEDVLGRAVHLNAGDYTVIGVAPTGFHGTLRTGNADVWLPAGAYGRVWHRPVDPADRRASIFDNVVGRLADGGTAAVAEQQLRAAMTSLVRDYPDMNGHYADYQIEVHEGIGLEVAARDGTRRTVRLLLGSACVLLLIACVNIANLLLVRGIARQGETAVRAALGASTGRLMQQYLAEGLLLSVAGGVCGIAVAAGIAALFQGQQFAGLPPIEAIAIDRRLVAFAFVGALLTGVVFTLLPAVIALRRALAGTIRRSGRFATDADSGVRASLLVLQVAASVTLLIGALMLVRTMVNLNRVDVGFDADRVLTFGVSPAAQGYTADRARAFRQRILDEVTTIPGVRTASVTSFAPFGEDRMTFGITAVGGSRVVRAATNEVSADYFETVGTPVIAGRSFNRQEERIAGGPGIVVSRAVARALFGNGDAVGRQVEVAGFTGKTVQTVIGVAADTRGSPRSGPQPAAYTSISTAALPQTYIVIRSDMTLAQAEPLVQDVIARIDPDIPFFSAELLATAIRRAAAEERLLARLLGTFATLAALLAAAGLYGVVSYSVAQRRREIGIRMAIGAHAGGVVRLVVGRSMKLVLGGSALGIAGGYAFSRILSGRMFGVTPTDAATYLAAFATFGVIALIASAPPAAAAARVDPSSTLRQE